MNKEINKQKAARAAFDLILPSLHEETILGIGTGSTTNYFIDELNKNKTHIKGAICSSESSKENLRESGINIMELNEVHGIDIYIDGADEFNSRFELIKGAGGALTREKVLANSSTQFICMVDDSKFTEMMRMGGKPVYRGGFITDSGNQIIDVSNLKIDVPYDLEALINNIPGVVENGIFAKRPADIILKASDKEIVKIERQ
jgi:ribose 5-phosphate isomerase A